MPEEYPTLWIKRMRRLDKLFGKSTILDRNLFPLPEGGKKGGVPSTSITACAKYLASDSFT
jgi:hypothetical protein